MNKHAPTGNQNVAKAALWLALPALFVLKGNSKALAAQAAAASGAKALSARQALATPRKAMT